jgi:UDP-N-acetylmuramate: L-alanyl-gamma-D-glutamyl-meso-diaminopimelate ligase
VERLARELGPKARAMPSVDAIVQELVASTRAGDTIALLSNGTFGGIHEKLLAALARRG